MTDSVSKPFNTFLTKAIDEGLNILGDDNVKQAFFYQVEKRGLQRSEIPVKLKAFHRIMIDFFGDGAFILERRMARGLHDNLGIKFDEHAGWTLEEYSQYAKKASRPSLTRESEVTPRKQFSIKDAREPVE